MKRTTFAILAACTAVLALTVVMVGAYVRLSNAGLGCPDWPGCYGRAAAPGTPEAVAQAKASYPNRPVEPAKARKEMVHRYLAGTLGLAIVLLAGIAWRYHRRTGLPVGVPTLLVALVIFQGLLGMWTVTLLVKPAIVTAHLAGGMATLALLWWLVLRLGGLCSAPLEPALVRLRPWAWVALVLVSAQILLGGWTSTNYAAVACTASPPATADSGGHRQTSARRSQSGVAWGSTMNSGCWTAPPAPPFTSPTARAPWSSSSTSAPWPYWC